MSEIRSIDIERIEDYLSGKMSPDDELSFETELKHNKTLFDLLRLYRDIDFEMRQSEKYKHQEAALQNTLQQLNAAYFNKQTPVIKMSRRLSVFKIAVAAAAILMLMLFSYYGFMQRKSDIGQLADRYVQGELLHLSVTMDGAKDSLQLGIAAYNNKAYTQANQLFEAVYQAHPQNYDALKYSGITYMVTKDYVRALTCFDELAAKKELFSNPGLFLKAVTLLQRNEEGDKAQAEQLLREVIRAKAEGSREAAQWLKK
ncbi:MAG TPA: hypothetical protein PKV73_17755 [Agriterribacter sp.]|nr:hypothetical protein [Chitinophagaceae bacterium]HRP33749.1 hypothetical protein [Agriterribacter sp.]